MTGIARLRSRVVTVICLLNLIAPAGLRAADAPGEAATAANPAPPNRHHKHKKKISASASGNGAVAPVPGTGSNTKTAAANTDAPGMSDSLGTNNPGSPNMGSQDHTPGTTGTSGQ